MLRCKGSKRFLGLWVCGLSLAVLCIAARAEESAPAELLASLSRTNCYGWCPAYSVAVATDGSVTYMGISYVVTRGVVQGHLDAAQLAALRDAFAGARFRELDEECCTCFTMTDMPTVVISLRDGAEEKRIEDYHGCKAAPDALRALEDRFDEIVNVEQWIGNAEERRALRD